MSLHILDDQHLFQRTNSIYSPRPYLKVDTVNDDDSDIELCLMEVRARGSLVFAGDKLLEIQGRWCLSKQFLFWLILG